MLDAHGYNAMPLKFDGYLNYDCGTMNPFRHGEVFVLDDGSEVDMDFGTYERFTDRSLDKAFSLTGGKVFSEVIAKERKGDFLGTDVQIIPHVTDLVMEKIERTAEDKKLDVMIIEVGGTVGDIENSYFVEALRQLSLKRKVVIVDVTYVPELQTVGEQKTKPTQIALRGLMQEGLRPDFIICRATRELDEKTRKKIALFSGLPLEAILNDNDTDSIYSLPSILTSQNLDRMLIERLGLELKKSDDGKVSALKVDPMTKKGSRKVSIAVVGKYINLHDSYASVKEALVHSAMANGADLKINWIESELLEDPSFRNLDDVLRGNSGILVPGGFGARGTEGMIRAIRHSRENKIPYLGLCLGMQLMTIEYARNVLGITDAGSAEFTETKNPIIHIMEDQKSVTAKGATMRLGAWEAKVKPDTLAHRIYGAENISERHRHRYEVNNAYRKSLEEKGMIISATTPDNNLVEIVEWKDSFGIGTQAHPEFKSRPDRPAPLFLHFIKAAIEAQRMKALV
jgi:CTP synthase